MATLRSDSPVQYIRGIGPVKAQWFASLGLATVADLLEYFPFRYETQSGEVEIADLRPGLNATVRGTVLRIRGRAWGALAAEIYDGTEQCTLRWFRQPFGARGLSVGATVIASGTVQEYNDRLELVQPRLQVFPPDAVVFPQQTGARQVGVYPGNAQVKSLLIRRAILNVLAQPRLPVDEFLPPELLRKHAFLPREAAVRQMHTPSSEAELRRARARLAYEEFVLLELAMALRRRQTVMLQVGQRLHVTPEVDRRIRARLPFALTSSQDAVVREIARDLGSGRPMTRLLQGDVGSGKTVVALYACLAAIANGKQAALMAPTEILAHQHFGNIERYLAGSRVRYVLLRGKLGRKERADALAAIERGEIDLVVGTQALIQKDVTFNNLALVVVDEQHKFGVLQRAEFRTKGPLPHYLVMTATPIPRTLAMTVFGDLDVSIIRHSPPGRGRITTKVVTGRQWETVMEYVRRRLEAGEQAYVVCPLIGEAEVTQLQSHEATEGGTGVPPAGRGNIAVPPVAPGVAHGFSREGHALAGAAAALPPKSCRAAVRTGVRNAGVGTDTRNFVSATQAFERLVHGPWRGLHVGLLHGALRPAEKQHTIEAFAAGQLHALVATTVVEVGVDVPNATIMIVEHADRFGLSQLHQLRGRIGRGHKDSLCVLIAHDTHVRPSATSAGEAAGDSPAAERLAVMTQTTDGFKIAEADLRQRGPGELLGTRQHGLPELRVGDLVNDFALLEKAREDAFEIVTRDPTLQQPEHRALRAPLKRLFGGKLALIDVA